MPEDKEIKKAVGHYLKKVAAELGDMRSDEKDTILQGIESHVYDTLAARSKGAPTVADLELVLAEMAPPASYRDASTAKQAAELAPKKLCKYPLIGAAFAPFGVVLGVIYVGDMNGPELERFVMPILVLGLLSPVITLVFGLIGISAIRTSRGGLTGMPLAVGLTLLYPLSLLDYALAFLAYQAGYHFTRASVFGQGGADRAYGVAATAEIVAILLALALNVYLIKRFWRWASRPLIAGGFT